MNHPLRTYLLSTPALTPSLTTFLPFFLTYLLILLEHDKDTSEHGKYEANPECTYIQQTDRYAQQSKTETHAYNPIMVELLHTSALTILTNYHLF